MTPEKRQEIERFVELQRAAIAAKGWVSLEVPDGFTVAGFESASRTVPVEELLEENRRLQAELDAIKVKP